MLWPFLVTGALLGQASQTQGMDIYRAKRHLPVPKGDHDAPDEALSAQFLHLAIAADPNARADSVAAAKLEAGKASASVKKIVAEAFVTAGVTVPAGASPAFSQVSYGNAALLGSNAAADALPLTTYPIVVLDLVGTEAPVAWSFTGGGGPFLRGFLDTFSGERANPQNLRTFLMGNSRHFARRWVTKGETCTPYLLIVISPTGEEPSLSVQESARSVLAISQLSKFVHMPNVDTSSGNLVYGFSTDDPAPVLWYSAAKILGALHFDQTTVIQHGSLRLTMLIKQTYQTRETITFTAGRPSDKQKAAAPANDAATSAVTEAAAAAKPAAKPGDKQKVGDVKESCASATTNFVHLRGRGGADGLTKFQAKAE
jgi:hypothetical protein